MEGSPSDVMPEGDDIRNAVRWVSDRKGEKDLDALMEEASVRFNLSPKKSDFLRRFFLTK